MIFNCLMAFAVPVSTLAAGIAIGSQLHTLNQPAPPV